MEDNQLAFLDTNFRVNEDGSLETTVYRKKTHTNQYLHFESHHPLSHKLGVVRTLMDRCDAIVSTTEDQKAEEDIITGALKTCGYPSWSITKVKRQITTKKTIGKPKALNATSPEVMWSSHMSKDCQRNSAAY